MYVAGVSCYLDTWTSYTHGLSSLLGQGHLDAVAEFLPGTTSISCPDDGLCPRLSAQGHMCLGLLPDKVLTEATSVSYICPPCLPLPPARQGCPGAANTPGDYANSSRLLIAQRG